MASVSLSLTTDQTSVLNPQNVVVGAAAPGAGDIELRVNTANITSIQQIILALCNFEYFTEDANLGPNAFKEL